MKVPAALAFIALSADLFSMKAIGSTQLTNQQTERASPDGRFNTNCDKWLKNEAKELCIVSMYRLIAVPEKYDKRLVEITGYLYEESGRWFIYPSQQSFANFLTVESVELFHIPQLKFDPRSASGKNLNCVVVVGVFDATYTGDTLVRLGAIRQIDHILVQPKVAPRLKR